MRNAPPDSVHGALLQLTTSRSTSALAIVLIGLGAQIRYAEAAVDCLADDRLIL